MTSWARLLIYYHYPIELPNELTRFITIEAFAVIVSVGAGVVDEQVGLGHLAEGPFDETCRPVEEPLEVFGYNDRLERD